MTLLGFLDPSAAFETVDHYIFLLRLDVSFGIDGSVLEWFDLSSLAGPKMTGSFLNIVSDFIPFRHGVPQGAVLGRFLSVLYSADVGRMPSML